MYIILFYRLDICIRKTPFTRSYLETSQRIFKLSLPELSSVRNLHFGSETNPRPERFQRTDRSTCVRVVNVFGPIIVMT